MRKSLWIVLPLMLFFSVACQSIENYETEDSPVFTGEYSESPPPFDGTLKVISWNIRFAEQIDAAIEELQTVPELQDADILLLQEMDETGVEAMARALGMNYVYFPASVHTHHDKNFGNAVLSIWPLSDPAKLLLPHKKSKKQAASHRYQRRSQCTEYAGNRIQCAYRNGVAIGVQTAGADPVVA